MLSPLSMAMGLPFRSFPEHLILTFIEEEILGAKTQPSTMSESDSTCYPLAASD